MNFFDFATLSRKKGSAFFSNSIHAHSTNNHTLSNDHIQVLKMSSTHDNKNDQKAFELIRKMNEELDQMINETEQKNIEIDKIIDDFSQLNQNMEVLFGKVVLDLKYKKK